MKGSVVIAAGGTGGHLVPALAIADALRRRDATIRIAFVGTARALDDELVRARGFPAYATTVRPFTRSARGALAPLSVVPAVVQARRALRAERACVVVGMGGYPSLPVVAAARLERIPAVIHEQNAVPGLANEAAALLTRNIAVSFPGAVQAFRSRTPRMIGVPLRDGIARFDRAALRPEAIRTFDLDPARRTVLVFGGSLGAARLNDAAEALARRWTDRADVQVLWVTGAQHAAAIRARIGVVGSVRIEGYVDRMDLAYAAADVVVSRAGASTVAELAVTGTPAILVPLPIARRREQDANAAALATVGGAIVLSNDDATADRIEMLCDALLGDEARRSRMADAARSIGRPDAADEMARWIIELAEAA